MKICRATAYRWKNYSTYVGVIGYTAMLITGSVALGAFSKVIAEVLRIPFYYHTDAKDMARLSAFFILASIILIAKELLWT